MIALNAHAISAQPGWFVVECYAEGDDKTAQVRLVPIIGWAVKITEASQRESWGGFRSFPSPICLDGEPSTEAVILRPDGKAVAVGYMTWDCLDDYLDWVRKGRP